MAPGMRLVWNTYPSWVYFVSPGQIAWLNWSWDLSVSTRAIPAAFQYRALASSATATKAPPIPAARAPIPIFRNCPSNVPTFSKIWAAPAIPGSITPRIPRPTITFLTGILLRPTRALADDDELAALGAQIGLDDEQVDTAHHVLAIA